MRRLHICQNFLFLGKSLFWTHLHGPGSTPASIACRELPNYDLRCITRAGWERQQTRRTRDARVDAVAITDLWQQKRNTWLRKQVVHQNHRSHVKSVGSANAVARANDRQTNQYTEIPGRTESFGSNTYWQMGRRPLLEHLCSLSRFLRVFPTNSSQLRSVIGKSGLPISVSTHLPKISFP